ncbi:TcdA/TcdB pore-forming domain-containing protein [Fluviispira sanaruensis]|uniref:TcdA/TcdB toxin pore forming domain-containing protein n=1 Tax=Fluviispira sanaruensis TaxID=2493639 RepID=A0A4P2VQK7_FLUSA|nr:TcdA/TcdB pore-forming domain-containing protein [Fluviispira sanaruensis]BBH54309.1 hypothetical protein JCM31447_27730 [Fluviispira sanaruensis]
MKVNSSQNKLKFVIISLLSIIIVEGCKKPDSLDINNTVQTSQSLPDNDAGYLSFTDEFNLGKKEFKEISNILRSNIINIIQDNNSYIKYIDKNLIMFDNDKNLIDARESVTKLNETLKEYLDELKKSPENVKNIVTKIINNPDIGSPKIYAILEKEKYFLGGKNTIKLIKNTMEIYPKVASSDIDFKSFKQGIVYDNVFHSLFQKNSPEMKKYLGGGVCAGLVQIYNFMEREETDSGFKYLHNLNVLSNKFKSKKNTYLKDVFINEAKLIKGMQDMQMLEKRSKSLSSSEDILAHIKRVSDRKESAKYYSINFGFENQKFDKIRKEYYDVKEKYGHAISLQLVRDNNSIKYNIFDPSFGFLRNLNEVEARSFLDKIAKYTSRDFKSYYFSVIGQGKNVTKIHDIYFSSLYKKLDEKFFLKLNKTFKDSNYEHFRNSKGYAIILNSAHVEMILEYMKNINNNIYDKFKQKITDGPKRLEEALSYDKNYPKFVVDKDLDGLIEKLSEIYKDYKELTSSDKISSLYKIVNSVEVEMKTENFLSAISEMKTSNLLFKDYVPFFANIENEPNAVIFYDPRNPEVQKIVNIGSMEQEMAIKNFRELYIKSLNNISPYLNKYSLEFINTSEISTLNSAFTFMSIYGAIKNKTFSDPHLSLAFKIQSGLNIAQSSFGVFSDVHSALSAVSSLKNAKVPLFITQLAKVSSAVDGGLTTVNVGIDIYNLFNARTSHEKAIYGTQLGFDTASLGLTVGGEISGYIGASSAGSILGSLAVPVSGLGIGISGLVNTFENEVDKSLYTAALLNDYNMQTQNVDNDKKRNDIIDEKEFINFTAKGINKLVINSIRFDFDTPIFNLGDYYIYKSIPPKDMFHGLSPATSNKQIDPMSVRKEICFAESGTLFNTRCERSMKGYSFLKINKPLVLPTIPKMNLDYEYGTAPTLTSRNDAEMHTVRLLESNSGFKFEHERTFVQNDIVKYFIPELLKTDIEIILDNKDRVFYAPTREEHVESIMNAILNPYYSGSKDIEKQLWRGPVINYKFYGPNDSNKYADHSPIYQIQIQNSATYHIIANENDKSTWILDLSAYGHAEEKNLIFDYNLINIGKTNIKFEGKPYSIILRHPENILTKYDFVTKKQTMISIDFSDKYNLNLMKKMLDDFGQNDGFISIEYSKSISHVMHRAWYDVKNSEFINIPNIYADVIKVDSSDRFDIRMKNKILDINLIDRNGDNLLFLDNFTKKIYLVGDFENIRPEETEYDKNPNYRIGIDISFEYKDKLWIEKNNTVNSNSFIYKLIPLESNIESYIYANKNLSYTTSDGKLISIPFSSGASKHLTGIKYDPSREKDNDLIKKINSISNYSKASEIILYNNYFEIYGWYLTAEEFILTKNQVKNIVEIRNETSKIIDKKISEMK